MAWNRLDIKKKFIRNFFSINSFYVYSVFLEGVYDQVECHETAHKRLSEVLEILKEILSKYPLLHSPDCLNAAKNIIKKIKNYNYADGNQGPEDYYDAIDQLALSFSSRYV